MGIKSWLKNVFALISLILANVWVQRVLLIIVLVGINVFAAFHFGLGLWPTLAVTGFFSGFWYKHQNLNNKYSLAVPPLIVFAITLIIYYFSFNIKLGSLINNTIVIVFCLLVFVCFFTGAVASLISLAILMARNKAKILKENPS
jgi:hypothetical protein